MKKLILVLILALLLRIYPFWGSHLVGDADPYYHIRVGAEVGDFDELSYGGRVHTYPPAFHWLLRLGHSITGNWLVAAKLLPVLLGLGTVCLIYSLGRMLHGERVGLFAAAVLATFPLHVQRTATFCRPDCLLLFLMVLIPWLAYTKRYLLVPFALAGMMLTSFGWPYGLVVACLLPVSLGLEQTEVKKALVALSLGLLLALTYWAPFFLRNGLPPLVQRASEQGIVSPSSFLMSLAFFAIVIAAGNLSLLQGRYFFALWSVFGVSMLVLGIRMLVYFSIPLAICMGLLFDEYLFKRLRLENLGSLEHLKESMISVAVVAVIMAFLFVSALFVKDFGPEAEEQEFEAIYWIGENLRGQHVASSWELGHYLTYFGAESLQDGYFEYAPDPLGREKAFRSLSPNELEEYGVEYLLVTKEDCTRIGGGCLGLWKGESLFKNGKAVVLTIK